MRRCCQSGNSNSLLLMDSKLSPRVGRAWRPIRRLVHFGPWCINHPWPLAYRPWIAYKASDEAGDAQSQQLPSLVGLRGFSVPSWLESLSILYGFDSIDIDKVSQTSRFLIISLPDNQLSRLSPSAIEKGLYGIGGSPKSVRRLRSGDLLIETTSAFKRNLLSKHFLDYQISVTVHKTLNSCRGVISDKGLMMASELEIIEGLSKQSVIAARGKLTIFIQLRKFQVRVGLSSPIRMSKRKVCRRVLFLVSLYSLSKSTIIICQRTFIRQRSVHFMYRESYFFY
ncbi:hypothetical protein AVEN_110028-1 [Araneus ventricosus]|uniref:Uncharacterized protein n=1 Tax=Araneus ventricosus TaxID=182803 RepID=A0A4Y2H4S1_ARAVE|nr:hypothetical protein AVEN_110028-1 [Araneus ventricosus]